MKSLSETIYIRKDFLIVLGPPRGGGLTFQSFDEIRRNRSKQSWWGIDFAVFFFFWLNYSVFHSHPLMSEVVMLCLSGLKVGASPTPREIIFTWFAIRLKIPCQINVSFPLNAEVPFSLYRKVKGWAGENRVVQTSIFGRKRKRQTRQFVKHNLTSHPFPGFRWNEMKWNEMVPQL